MNLKVSDIRAEVNGHVGLTEFFEQMSSRTIEEDALADNRPQRTAKSDEFDGYGDVSDGEFSGLGDVPEGELGGYGDVPNSEFAGHQIFPDNAKDLVALFLSMSALHSVDDVISEFEALDSEDNVAAAYDEAKKMIAGDVSLAAQVVNVAGNLDIPLENLSLQT